MLDGGLRACEIITVGVGHRWAMFLELVHASECEPIRSTSTSSSTSNRTSESTQHSDSQLQLRCPNRTLEQATANSMDDTASVSAVPSAASPLGLASAVSPPSLLLTVLSRVSSLTGPPRLSARPTPPSEYCMRPVRESCNWTAGPAHATRAPQSPHSSAPHSLLMMAAAVVRIDGCALGGSHTLRARPAAFASTSAAARAAHRPACRRTRARVRA